MTKLTPKSISRFLVKYNLKVDQLALLAGVHRWSLRRFMKNNGSQLQYETAYRLQRAMLNFRKQS